jgi:hypothetical protein
MDLGLIRDEIERMRIQVGRQRKELLQLQQAGIATGPAAAGPEMRAAHEPPFWFACSLPGEFA